MSSPNRAIFAGPRPGIRARSACEAGRCRSIAAIVAYAVLTHPSELIAAALWFLLVTWLVARSQNIWNAVAAHATTDLLLGVWVLAMKQFWLW